MTTVTIKIGHKKNWIFAFLIMFSLLDKRRKPTIIRTEALMSLMVETADPSINNVSSSHPELSDCSQGGVSKQLWKVAPERKGTEATGIAAVLLLVKQSLVEILVECCGGQCNQSHHP